MPVCRSAWSWSAGTLQPFPTPDALLDAVFLSFTLELFDTPEIPIVLQQCRRVLKKDGRLCVVAMGKGTRDTWMMRLYEWSHRVFPASVDCRPIPSEAFVREAGFEITQIQQAMMFGLPVDIVLARVG